MRLLGQTFLQIQPVKDGQFAVGAKYKCETELYGDMGVVECLAEFRTHMADMRPMMMLLSAGHARMKDDFMVKNVKSLDLVSCGTFRFVRRSDEAFKNMLDGETPKAGLNIVRQTTLL